MNATRRNLCKGLLAIGAMPVFNIGCAGFGESRARQLAKGAKTRIAIIGCGDWGRALLTRAGLVGGCELVAICDPDPVNTGLEFSVPLAKTLMLANMLAFAGKGTYSFDGENTDNAAANAHASHAYREGWEIATCA